jgi:hypothetical protein
MGSHNTYPSHHRHHQGAPVPASHPKSNRFTHISSSHLGRTATGLANVACLHKHPYSSQNEADNPPPLEEPRNIQNPPCWGPMQSGAMASSTLHLCPYHVPGCSLGCWPGHVLCVLREARLRQASILRQVLCRAGARSILLCPIRGRNQAPLNWPPRLSPVLHAPLLSAPSTQSARTARGRSRPQSRC